MEVRYIRVSGVGRKTVEAQKLVLGATQGGPIYIDDGKTKGTELTRAVAALSAGDVLVVTSLDRLGKRVKGLIDLIHALHSKGIGLKSIEDGLDTTTIEGAYLTRVADVLIKMDKALVTEATQVSLAVAKAKGRTGGRPPALSEEKMAEAKKLISEGMPVRAVAKKIGSNQATLYRLIGPKPV
jgi:DNA invertase Pin-like site-specific DNA recombinase